MFNIYRSFSESSVRDRHSHKVLAYQVTQMFLTGILTLTAPMSLMEPVLISENDMCKMIWIMHNQETKFVHFLEFKPLCYLVWISSGVNIFQGLFLTTGPTRKLEFIIFL